MQQYRSQIGTILSGETPFEGTIKENITFNDTSISHEDLKWVIDAVRLGDFVKSLPQGLDTKIFPEGKQLSSSNAKKILLARSIIHKPKVLFYENPTDTMDENVANEIIDYIVSDEHRWTVIVSSKDDHWKNKCSRIITLQNGKILTDLKKESHA